MFYEKKSDCQLTNKQSAKRLKYINKKKENNVQYLKDKINVAYQIEIKNKDIHEYGIEKKSLR